MNSSWCGCGARTEWMEPPPDCNQYVLFTGCWACPIGRKRVRIICGGKDPVGFPQREMEEHA